jgi:hypothetical protein
MVRLPRNVLNQRMTPVIEGLFRGSRGSDKLIASSIEIFLSKNIVTTLERSQMSVVSRQIIAYF